MTIALPPVAANPVYDRDFPDPFVLPVDDAFYAYATNGAAANIQVIRSSDLVTWEPLGDALPALPSWAAPGAMLTWAPSVLARDNEYILYYVTRFVESGRQCISYAVSENPAGPFVDPNAQPFICQLDEGGSIDPEPFTDADGTRYLLWKSDGNCCDLPIYIYAQELSEDGRSLLGEPVRLITKDQTWEEPLIENPSMTLHDGVYYLIYSANWWEGRDYAVGYARCESPLGPCVKPQDGPILSQAGLTVGTGGASFFTTGADELAVAYHAWKRPHVGYPDGRRALYLAPVTFNDGALIIEQPPAE